jgi:hypothetical protein
LAEHEALGAAPLEELAWLAPQKAFWLPPEAIARIDFLEWTGADHHTKYVALGEDKDP